MSRESDAVMNVIGVSATGVVGNVLVYSNIVPDQNPGYSEIDVTSRRHGRRKNQPRAQIGRK